MESDTFENHEWKSTFAADRSGRNSPNIFAKFRKRFLQAPPVRSVTSPKFTEEELDALTGDLPYETNYTYAYSKIYDPSLPDHWEVPNLLGTARIPSPDINEKHLAAASVSRQIFNYLSLPFLAIYYLIITIVEHVWEKTQLRVLSFWEYILYQFRRLRQKYLDRQDIERRKEELRKKRDGTNGFSNHHLSIFTQIWLVIVDFFTTSYKAFMFVPRKVFEFASSLRNTESVEQYNYKSIKPQLKNERESRIADRMVESVLTRTRRFNGPSLSPSRRVLNAATELVTSSASGATRRLHQVFHDDREDSPLSTQLKSFRNVKNRSLTPTRKSTGVNFSKPVVAATREIREDTPLSVYGLRSRRVARNEETPEPTFDDYTKQPSMGPAGKSILKKKSPPPSSTIWSSIYQFLFSRSGFSVLHIFTGLFAMISAILKNNIYLPILGMLYPEHTVKSEVRAEIAARDLTDREQHRLSRISYGQMLTEVMGLPLPFHTRAYYVTMISATRANQQITKVTGSPYFYFPLLLLLGLFLIGWASSPDTYRRVKMIDPKVAAKGSYLEIIPNILKNFFWSLKEYFIDVVFFIRNIHLPIISGANKLYDVVCSILTFVEDIVLAIAGPIRRALFWIVWQLFTFSQYCYRSFTALLPERRELKDTVVNVGTPKTDQPNVVDTVISYPFTWLKWSASKLFAVYSTVTDNVLTTLSIMLRSSFSTVAWIYNNTLHLISSVFGLMGSSMSNGASIIGSTFWSTFNFVTSSILNLFGAVGAFATNSWSTVTTGSQYFLGKSQTGFEGFCSKLSSVFYYLVDLIWLVFHWLWTGISTIFLAIGAFFSQSTKSVETPPPIVVTPGSVNIKPIMQVPAPAPPTPAIPVIMPAQQAPVIQIDKAAIMAEIYGKLRDELSAKFHEELTIEFEKNYNTIIQKLTVQNMNMKVDNAHLEALIRQMIYEYDADKTGQVDYALESSGASVLSTRCSETYNSYSRLEKIWNIPLWYSTYGPRTVIQRNSKTLFPGECWSFKNGRGYLTVDLSHHIDISSVSYEHIGKELAPGGNRQSAPKGMLIWAYKHIDDIKTRVLIGDYTYDLEGPQLQFFIAKNQPDFPVKIIEMEITSNYGAEFTCLYRLRVHGKVHHFE